MKTQEKDILITKFLAGEASESEIAALSSWRNSDAAHEEQFIQSRTIWDQSQQEQDADQTDTDAAWLKLEDRLKENSRKSAPGWIKIAAAILLLSVAGWFAYQNLYNPVLLIQTAANERKEIILPDGSHVWLNESSELSYPKKFAGKYRDIRLTGEAFFEVVKNPEQPFVITTRQAITEVLGTSFNLKALKESKEAILSVITGRVRFTSTDNTSEVIVVAGEKAEINETGNAIRNGSLDENEIAWKSDKLVFNDAQLKDVFTALETHYRIKITVENPAILPCHFTGSFESAKVDEVLNIISKALQLTYTRKGKVVTIKGKGCAL